MELGLRCSGLGLGCLGTVCSKWALAIPDASWKLRTIKKRRIEKMGERAPDRKAGLVPSPLLS